ncbi:hypothetical protein [Methylobacterium sp. Leaf93]|uniref:hypothetical protein n=1 Tax=Methylobacterium sp. Leaf93 TaxID=1736249 RepID=UPI00138F6AA9|nr:hypothetical protein [Methylobacterium sp. Leaf93]
MAIFSITLACLTTFISNPGFICAQAQQNAEQDYKRSSKYKLKRVFLGKRFVTGHFGQASEKEALRQPAVSCRISGLGYAVTWV